MTKKQYEGFLDTLAEDAEKLQLTVDGMNELATELEPHNPALSRLYGYAASALKAIALFEARLAAQPN